MKSVGRPLLRRVSGRLSGRLLDRIRLLTILSTVLATCTCSLALLLPAPVLGTTNSVPLEPATIGISFGDIYSSILYKINGTITPHPSSQNQTYIPTCIAFTETGEAFIGEAARAQWYSQPQRTICNLKDVLRMGSNDGGTQMHESVDDRDLPSVQIFLDREVRPYTPEKLAGLFFQGLKDIAEDYIGQNVSDTIISVRLGTTELERDTVKRAVELGGFERVQTVLDGVLASLAYDLDEGYNSNGQGAFVLVYEIGATSIEMCVMEVDEGVFEVLSTSEDKSINDTLLHSELVNYVRELYPDLEDVETSLLNYEMERVRRILLSEDIARFTITTPHSEQSFRGIVTREDINRVLAPYLPRIVAYMTQVTHNANLTLYDLSEIIPISGTAIVPALQTHLSHDFPSAIKIRDSISPQNVVVYGLAKLLSIPHPDAIVGNYEISVHSLGIRTAGDIITPILHRIMILPAEMSRIFTTVKDYQERAVIELYEGDRITAGDNAVLGRIEVENIPLAKRGDPRINVTIKYTDSTPSQYTMIVTLEGKDGEQTIMDNLLIRSYEETKAIIDDVEDNEEEDLVHRERIEARLAAGEISTDDTDVVEVGQIWWNK
ncbi:heat shock protein 70 family [Phaeosphaeria sp. MPI-PUGE-AT-0046c]|nr:heat shock protein 70 family [Phaeosphaeria sp. MPI-PUGE-AT-0046c]